MTRVGAETMPACVQLHPQNLAEWLARSRSLFKERMNVKVTMSVSDPEATHLISSAQHPPGEHGSCACPALELPLAHRDPVGASLNASSPLPEMKCP